ncbi:hypothetical protein GA417_01700 [Poseidonibacter ostreae]|uniref:Wzz/FepE/Etk N-terminal domain-containing protein n=1 Tax=Poseidonibacter ostreae TaxID=2654171 RepID=UPI0012644F50|nr:Wzz/FepE/Etk N-terminal domain-containing protein [Poseidonibacter ostreae]KAB7887680.1 hypothetical protein GA417_01700 [Poseidonibacter ostreae]
MNDNNEKGLIQEDEIDLRELFLNIWEQKLFIFVFTTIITTFSIVYAYTKTPIYEVTSNIQIGYIGDKVIKNSEEIVRNTEAYFESIDLKENRNEFISELSSITQAKKIKNFITIKTEATSNEKALKKNQEVLSYIQNLNKQKIAQYKTDINNKIKNDRKDITNLNNLEKINLQYEINKIKTQKIKLLSEKIDRLKSQDIKRIDNQIKFYQDNKIKQINSKIIFNQENLNTYNKNVNKIYSEIKDSSNSTLLTVSSLQMTNYQNLILNAQNKIEDLKLEKKKILLQTLKDLELKKKNIYEIDIKNLEREKADINNNDIRKLEYKMNVAIPNKELDLYNDIKQLEFLISEENIQNSKIIGDYMIYDYPIKPKKKLIVVVGFTTALIVSIFLSLLISFVRNKN